MVKVIILATGELKEVQRNEAHDLIDGGKAMLPQIYEEKMKSNTFRRQMGQYQNRQMKSSENKGF